MKIEKQDDLAQRELRGFVADGVLYLKDTDGKNVMLRDGGKITVGPKRGAYAFSELGAIERNASERFYAGDTLTITITL